MRRSYPQKHQVTFVFADPLLASAGLDRLLHHAQVITITGRSFRAHPAQAESNDPAPTPPPDVSEPEAVAVS